MKLSEAILLGSTISGQCHSILCIEYSDGRVETCALGAAALALGRLSYTTIEKMFPWTMETFANCPSCDQDYGVGSCNMTIEGMIQHLNDAHRWTRERIAEWVATIEPDQEQASEEVGTSKPLATENGFVDEKDLKTLAGLIQEGEDGR